MPDASSIVAPAVESLGYVTTSTRDKLTWRMSQQSPALKAPPRFLNFFFSLHKPQPRALFCYSRTFRGSTTTGFPSGNAHAG